MIHLVTLNPALDLNLHLKEPSHGKIGKVLTSKVEAGGKGLNVARFLKKFDLTAKIWMGTGGGNHLTHYLFRSLLKSEGLFPYYLSSEAPIRFNVVVEKDRKTKKYNHSGFEMVFQNFDRFEKSLKNEDFLVLTGSLPHGMNPDLYGAWITSFKKRKIITLLDTSGLALRKALNARPWFFKVNLFEFSEAQKIKFKGLKDVLKFLPYFYKSGLKQGAVTNGAEGSLVWNALEVYWLRFTHQIVRPIIVGAGDGFLAGYLEGLMNHRSFMDTARMACATGTAVAMTGIQKFDPKLVDHLKTKIKVVRYEGFK